MKNGFTEEDIECFIELLNLVATNAEFSKMTVKTVLRFSKLLNVSQTVLIPKMKDHIFEIKKIEHVAPPVVPKRKGKTK